MLEYKNLVNHILKNGKFKQDRTTTGTVSVFGTQNRYDLRQGFPLLTLKKTWWNGVIHELLWFLKGDTNITYLIKNNVNIWNEWPFQKYQQSNHYQGETISQFAAKIINDQNFAKKWGDLGPIYGRQWRNFEGIDQLKNVIEEIRNNPSSRRLIVSAWNPLRLKSMLLPPCHAFFQFYVSDNQLSLQLYQRSADVFLGVPFNIASYSLLLLIIAQLTNTVACEFIHTIGDAHIYTNHLEQCQQMMSREPKKLPTVKISSQIKSINEVKFEDIKLENYHPHPAIKGAIAI